MISFQFILCPNVVFDLSQLKGDDDGTSWIYVLIYTQQTYVMQMIRYRFTLKKVRHVKILNPPISTHGRMFFFFSPHSSSIFTSHKRRIFFWITRTSFRILNVLRRTSSTWMPSSNVNIIEHSWISVKVDCIQVKKEYFIHFTFNCEFIVDKFNKRWKFSRYTNRYLHGEKNWI